MSGVAREIGAILHAGSIVERSTDGTLYNTSLVYGPDGSRLATYRKIHRFGHGEGEAKLMGPGEEILPVITPLGVMALATCYDLRFPELFRRQVDVGAELSVICSSWPARRIEHWSLLNRARAIENQMFVIACNAAGSHAGVPQGGHSMVVDPWGRVVAEAGSEPTVLTAEIDVSEVAKTRAEFPVLADRRL